MATLLLRAQGAGPTVIVSPAARPDAQPDRRGRARRHPRGDDQLHQPRAVGRDPPRDRAPARSTSCWSAPSGSTTRASATRCCRGWRRPAACSWSTRPTASATGATTSAPTTAASAPCSASCPTASRCSRPPRPPTRGSPPTSPSSSAPTPWCCAARSTASRCAWASCGSHRRSSAWPGWPTTSPSSPAPASSTASPSPRPTRSPTTSARAATSVAAYSGQTETTERPALEEALITGEVKALIATSALGMGFDARARLRGQPRRPAVAGRLLPAGRPRRPRRARRPRRHRRAAAGPRGPRHLGLLRLADLPARAAGAPDPRGARRGGSADVDGALETRVELSRTRLEQMLKVLDVDGAVRRVRGGWEATGRPWSYDEERYRRVREAREREQQAMLDYLATDRLPDALPARPARRPRRRRLRALRQLRRPGPRRHRLRGVGRRGRRAARRVPACRSSRARCGPPAWPRWASSSRARSRRAPRRAAPIARLTDLGHGQALRDLFRPGAGDGPVPPVPGPRAGRRADGLAAPGRRPRRRRVAQPARPDRRPRGQPVAVPEEAGARPLRRSSTPTSSPAAAR